jgi:hypothetical protein
VHFDAKGAEVRITGADKALHDAVKAFVRDYLADKGLAEK